MNQVWCRVIHLFETMASRGDIEWPSRCYDLISNPLVEKLRCDQIYRPSSHQRRELGLDSHQREAWDVSWLKLDQDVDIAVGSKVIAQHRPEERKAGDVVPPAEGSHGVAVD